jgi:heat shock protein HslJ/uncharacterized membrane protein
MGNSLPKVFLLYPLLILCGLSLIGCNPDQTAGQQGADTLTEAGDTLREGEGLAAFAHLQEAGVDFLATGNEPFWSLHIDFGGQLRFTTLEGDTLLADLPEPNREKPKGQVQFEASSLVATVEATPCQDDMSGARLSHRVAVTFKGITYTGCGRYLFGAAALDHNWTLSALAGAPVPAPQLPLGLPTLHLQVLEQQVQGFTGCNRLTGRVLIDRDRIRFFPLATTRMACLGQDLEQPFLEALQQTNRYRVEGNHLLLLQDQTELLRFIRQD